MELVPIYKESLPVMVFMVLKLTVWLKLKFSNKSANDLIWVFDFFARNRSASDCGCSVLGLPATIFLSCVNEKLVLMFALNITSCNNPLPFFESNSCTSLLVL